MGRFGGELGWGALALGLGLFGCADGAQPKLGPAREKVESLWEFAPQDASAGVVANDGALDKVLALVVNLAQGEAKMRLEAFVKKRSLGPIGSVDGWSLAGLDPKLGAAAFVWPDKARGPLLVLPVTNRDRFATALHLSSHQEGGRKVDELEDLVCAEVASHYLCARTLADVDAAAGRHAAPLAQAAARLPPNDKGDIEFLADIHNRDVTKLAESAKLLGAITGVGGQVRFHAGGASARVHVMGAMTTPLAAGLAGGGAPSGHAPLAAGAATVVRLHFDPKGLPPSQNEDPRLRSELIDLLAGDVEVTTSGHGLAGAFATAKLTDPARAEAYVKHACDEAGGSIRKLLLEHVAVQEHGCTAAFNPHMMLLPVAMDPLPVAVLVRDGELVVTVGDARAPSADERTIAVAKDPEALAALGGSEALVAFTRSPWLGPDAAAGRAVKDLFSLIPDEQTKRLDAFDDLAMRVADAWMAAHVAEDGAVVTFGFDTFATDPEPAQKAYEAALALRAAGDVKGYRARLADIEKEFPGTLVASRAKLVGESLPFVGAGVIVMGALGSGAKKAKK